MSQTEEMSPERAKKERCRGEADKPTAMVLIYGAQTEISAKIKHAGIGVGAFGGAGVLALYGLAVLIAAAVLRLALGMPPWLAALIVGVVVLAIAGVVALVGKKQLGEAAPAVPEKTVASVKEDVAEIKESIQK